MEISINIPEYDPTVGIKYKWEDDFEIHVKYLEGTVLITANTEGLISLANHILNLAQTSVPRQCHLHFDQYNSLEEGSSELIIEKI